VIWVNRHRIIICTVILCGCAVTCAATGAQDAAAAGQGNAIPLTPTGPPGEISGHVYRADSGAPIPKAIVTVRGPSERMTRTEADGSYSFVNVYPGNYGIEVTRTGFIDGTSRALVKPGEKVEKIDVRLPLAGVISGKVIDLDSDPVEGLRVFAIRPLYSEGGAFQEDEIRETKTDDRGEFRLTGLPAGIYFVRAGGSGKNTGGIVEKGVWSYHTSYYPGSPQMETAQSIKVGAGADVTGINLQVSSVSRNAYMIKGNVSGTSVLPQINVLVGDEIIEDARVDRGQDAPRTFTISGVSPGQYTIVARSFEPTNYSPGPTGMIRPQSIHVMVGTAAVNVEAADTSVNIQMGEIGEVRGRIVLERTVKTDFNGVDLELDPQSGIGAEKKPYPPNTEVETAPNGTFTVKYIMPGSYFFSVDDGPNPDYVKEVECGGRAYTSEPIEIEVGTKLEDCRVTISADVGTITGSVMDGDKPAPGFVVIAIPQSRAMRRNPQYTNDVRTDANGQFQLPLIPGDYFLFAVPHNDQDSYYALDFAERNEQFAERVSVKAGEAKSIQLKPSAAQ
jgi:hypothetical protein